MKIEITPEERQMILYGLQDRASKLYELAALYKKNRDVESQKDCISESRKVLALYDKIHAL